MDTMAVQPFKSNSEYSSAIYAMAVIDSELYFGGAFDSVIGFPCKSFAKWNGSIITPVGLSPNMLGGSVYAIQKYRDYIYIGGNFSSTIYPDDTLQSIIRYDGTNWKSVGGGIKGWVPEVISMNVYRDELYVAGTFTRTDGNLGNAIQKWDGVSWSDVGGGVDGGGHIEKLIVYHDKLYAMGTFTMIGGVSTYYIASWDGTNWCAEESVFSGPLSVSCIYDDSLIVGGAFFTINEDTMNCVSKCPGDAFTAACGNLTSANESQSQDSFTIYPNPTSNQITIEFDTTEPKSILEIKNVLGQTVYSEIINEAMAKQNKNINVSAFSNGIYFMQLRGKEKIGNKKFIKN